MTVVLLAQNKANYKSIIEEKSGCPGNNTFISFVSELFLSHGAITVHCGVTPPLSHLSE